MSFFSGSSGFMITGGTFNLSNTHFTTEERAEVIADAKLRRLLKKRKEHGSGEFELRRRCSNGPIADVVDQLSGERKECETAELDADRQCRYSGENSVGLMIIKRDELDLRSELISRKNYRIHAASHGPGGRVVAVKVFEGPHAERDWTINVAFSGKLFHSNVLKVVGISEESSETPFVVFHGISEKRMQSMIAKALRTDLNTSVQLSMKAVKGLAAGLSYLKSQKFPLHSGATNINSPIWEDFDIFASDNNEPIIAINPPSVVNDDDPITESFDHTSDGYGIEVLNGLCQKLFSEANSILYGDSPVREFDDFDAERLPTAAIEQNPEGISIISRNDVTASTPSRLKKKPKLSRNPRREVWWRRLNMGVSNRSRSLDAIARLFADHLDCILSSSFNSPLRRIRASRSGHSTRSSHQCPGYLREEITLTSEVSRSAIISHEYPSQSELCSVCGQLVRYELDSSDNNVTPKPTLDGQQEQRDQGSLLTEAPQNNTPDGDDDVHGRGGRSTFHIVPVSGGDRHPSVPAQQLHEQIQTFTFPGSSNNTNARGNNNNNFLSPDIMRQAVYSKPGSQGPRLPSLEDVWLHSPGVAGPSASVEVLSVSLNLPSDENGHEHSRSVPSVGVARRVSPYSSIYGSLRAGFEKEQENVHGESGLGMDGMSIGSLNAHNMDGMAMCGKGSDGLGSLGDGLTMDLPGVEIGIGGGGPIDAGLDTNANPVENWNVTSGQPANTSKKRDTNFLCPMPGCNSTFTKGFNLKGHLRWHIEPKPYCYWPGCGKGFSRQHHLNCRVGV